MRILLSGACGFVGSILARALTESGHKVFGFDNFIRPGSETNRLELKKLGLKLFHADLRSASDFESLPACDFVIDAAPKHSDQHDSSTEAEAPASPEIQLGI